MGSGREAAGRAGAPGHKVEEVSRPKCCRPVGESWRVLSGEGGGPGWGVAARPDNGS